MDRTRSDEAPVLQETPREQPIGRNTFVDLAEPPARTSEFHRKWAGAGHTLCRVWRPLAVGSLLLGASGCATIGIEFPPPATRDSGLPDIVPRIYNPSVFHRDGRDVLRFGVLTQNVGEGPTDIRTVQKTNGRRASYQLLYEDGRVAQQQRIQIRTGLPDEAHHIAHHLQDEDPHAATGARVPYHFKDFAYFGLVDSRGVPVIVPKLGDQVRVGDQTRAPNGASMIKQDWTMVDSRSMNGAPPFENWAAPIPGQVDMDVISGGWADDYPPSLQKLDITDVPPGRYSIVVESNPQQSVLESNFHNNETRFEIEVVVDAKGNKTIRH